MFNLLKFLSKSIISCRGVFLIHLLLFLSGCAGKKQPRDVERSFYYWKSSFKLHESEQKILKALKVNRLYIKFFDIAWNEEKKQPMPMAIIKFQQNQAFLTYNIIPTVFITNDCIQKITDKQVKILAEKILLLIKSIILTNGITSIPEIQLDCDWNEETKNKYFLLLQVIRPLLSSEKKLLSATIRLYQYKYFKKLGIPPVDRGLLMCYNMGNLKSPDIRNSILEPEELKKYLGGFIEYPLPLDIALPIFSWKVLFRNKKYAGLLRELPDTLFKNNPVIEQSGNNYRVLQLTSINGYSFQPGDVLRDEDVTYRELIKAVDILGEKLKTQHLRVVLYHLDSITLSKFSINELETIFDHLR